MKALKKLIKFRIKNYKSIKDSGWCWLASDLTILAGKNESGKTAILEALRDFYDSAKNLKYPEGPPREVIPLDGNENPIIEMCFEVEEDFSDKIGKATGITLILILQNISVIGGVIYITSRLCKNRYHHD
ncbi:MAG: AAA family ATPase [Nitrospinae bacterium]|nr:AAA family ATPase [Nitrospinota bacterium]